MDNAIDDSTVSCQVQALANGVQSKLKMDRVAIEAPLELRIAGNPATVLMRTPGDDEELARGFLFNEGIIRLAEDIESITRPSNLNATEQGNVLDVRLKVTRKKVDFDRNFYSSSSCGVCGKNSISALAVEGPLCDATLAVTRHVLARLPDALRAAQTTFSLTGGVHASGMFTPNGDLLVVREDVGRHNALDKVIGWALTAGKLPLSEYLLLISGRVSYELIQKAVAASIPLVVAVGAPSSLAVELAERFKITLIGFLRGSAMNVYTHAHRVTDN